MMNEEIWKEGYEAFLDGAEKVHCPYEEGTVQHLDWMAGYECAESDG